MIKVIRFAGLLFLFCSPALQAGTIVEIQNNNELSTVLTNGQVVRLNMTGADYAIVDHKDHSIKLVSPQKQQVLLLNVDGMTTGKKAPAVRTLIKKLGAGQVIAGYKTQQFAYTANGKPCGIIHGSKDAFQAEGVKELFSAMTVMMEKQLAELGALAGMLDVCTLADMQLGNYVNTIGLPMRTEKNGSVEIEIKSIKADVTLADDTFVIPASYKILGAKQQIKAVSKDLAKPQPQTQQPQMQQSRQLPPQALQQMRRAQGMMRQYQRPGY